MARKALSIIVPVFNTEEQFLRTCLASIEKLQDDKIEVIVVDDGSNAEYSDWLASVVDEYALNACVLHKTNGGQNDARCFGLNEACGEYVLFVDSDDFIVADELKKLVSLALRERPDILCFNYDIATSEGRVIAQCGYWNGGYHVIDAKSELVLKCGSLFKQLYKRNFLAGVKNPLIVGPKIGEDTASSVFLAIQADKVAAIGISPYVYVQRPSSMMHARGSQNILDILSSMDMLLERLGADCLDYESQIEALCIEHVLFWGGLRAIQTTGNEVSAYKQIIFQWMDGRFPQWRHNAYYARLCSKHGVKFRLIANGRWGIVSFLSKCRHIAKGALSHRRG